MVFLRLRLEACEGKQHVVKKGRSVSGLPMHCPTQNGISYDRDAIRQKALHQMTSTPYTDGPSKSVVSRRSCTDVSPVKEIWPSYG